MKKLAVPENFFVAIAAARVFRSYRKSDCPCHESVLHSALWEQ